MAWQVLTSDVCPTHPDFRHFCLKLPREHFQQESEPIKWKNAPRALVEQRVDAIFRRQKMTWQQEQVEAAAVTYAREYNNIRVLLLAGVGKSLQRRHAPRERTVWAHGVFAGGPATHVIIPPHESCCCTEGR